MDVEAGAGSETAGIACKRTVCESQRCYTFIYNANHTRSSEMPMLANGDV